MEGMIKRRFEQGEMEFHDEMDQLMDEYDDEQKQLTHEPGPGKDDTIH
jgi:hypothetical protein